MKTAMSALAAALLVSPQIHAADSPVRIAVNGTQVVPKVHVMSVADSIIINDITVNRGNCKVVNKNFVTNKPAFPVTLKYGQEMMVFVGNCAVIEVDVATSQGSWKVKY